MLCNCPPAASLDTIPVVLCTEDFGQIQKVAFQRINKDTSTKNKFSTTNKIEQLSSWTSLLTAINSEKIVISPYIQAPTVEAGAARTFGGGNDTLGGIPEIVGREATTFTAALRKIPQNVIKILKELQCESWVNNLGVYLFDANGQIGGLKNDNGTEWYPIPIISLFVGDKTFGNFDAPDSNTIQWSFLPNWSDNFGVAVPEFNPLTDLSTISSSD